MVCGREAGMGGIEVAVAMVILFAFAIGITIGVVLIVSVASRREDKLHSLWGEAPDAACRGVRRLVGAGVMGGGPLSGFPSREEGDTAQGQEPYR
jgi:hypothetical protein